MDFKQIHYFVQVAELGSFTRAASLLRVAQPALSRQVRALEVELRQALFDRNGRGVTLTPAGQRLLAHGRGILQQLERARLDLEDQRGAATGLLSIGLPPSIGRSLTAPLVEAFRERFPKATLSMVEGLSTYLLEWLVQGRIDCAVVYNATPAAAITLLPVLEEQLYLVTSRAGGSRRRSSASLAGVAREPVRRAKASVARRGALTGPATALAHVAAQALVIPSRPHAIRMRLETVLAAAGLKPRVGLEIESVPAILDLVQRHPEQGWHAVLPLNALLGSGLEDSLFARPIRLGAGQATLSTTLWVATSAQRPQGALLEQALVLLQQLLRQRLANE